MDVVIPRRARRARSETFKQSVISACSEPGVSVAGVALANGLNANQVRRWMRERSIEPPSRRKAGGAELTALAGPGFVPVTLTPAAVPLDMRAGMDTLLAQVVCVFGEAQPHHAYLFSNRRGTRLKVLVHDGFGVWLASRRLNQGRFHWTEGHGR